MPNRCQSWHYAQLASIAHVCTASIAICNLGSSIGATLHYTAAGADTVKVPVPASHVDINGTLQGIMIDEINGTYVMGAILDWQSRISLGIRHGGRHVISICRYTQHSTTLFLYSKHSSSALQLRACFGRCHSVLSRAHRPPQQAQHGIRR